MKRTLIAVVAALVLLGGVWIAYQTGALVWLGYSPARPERPTASAAASGGGADYPDGDSGPREVAAIGRLEPAGGILTIGEALGDRLSTLEVSEGSVVAQDQLLALLDSRRLRELEIQSYDAQIIEATARRAAEENLADARIESAKLAVKRAESQDIEIEAQEKQVALYAANLALEKKNLARLGGLSEELVSTQERERQTLLVQKSAAELSASQATLERLKQTGEFSLAAAKADLAAATAGKAQVISAIPVESLKKARDVAQINYDRTAILAPSKGTVLKIFTRPGEAIGRKPILQMADLDQMVCVAEVYETEVQRLSLGQRAILSTPALSTQVGNQRLRGTITRIGQIIATPEMRSLDPFARADRHVVDVRIELDARSSRLASGLVNLQVDVRFEPARDGSLARAPGE